MNHEGDQEYKLVLVPKEMDKKEIRDLVAKKFRWFAPSIVVDDIGAAVLMMSHQEVIKYLVKRVDEKKDE